MATTFNIIVVVVALAAASLLAVPALATLRGRKITSRWAKIHISGRVGAVYVLIGAAGILIATGAYVADNPTVQFAGIIIMSVAIFASSARASGKWRL